MVLNFWTTGLSAYPFLSNRVLKLGLFQSATQARENTRNDRITLTEQQFPVYAASYIKFAVDRGIPRKTARCPCRKGNRSVLYYRRAA